MGHRHLIRTSHSFEMDHDPNSNHVRGEQPYLHIGATRAGENGTFVFPAENQSTRFAHWNSTIRSTDHPSSSISMELPHYPLPASGPFYDPLLNPSAARSFCLVPQNYSDCPSSSHPGPIMHGVEDDVDNSTMANGRGPCKRKSPVTSVVCDQASTSNYHIAGTSSDFSTSSNSRQEKLTLGSQGWAWDPMGITPNYGESDMSVAGGSQRNVRSRSTLDLEMNLARTHLSNDPYHHLHSVAHPLNRAGMNVAGASASATTHDWDHVSVPSAACGRIMPSDTSGLSQGMDQFPGASSANSSMALSGHHHGLISTRSSVGPHHNLHGTATQAGRGGCVSAQRSTPAYRVTSGYPRLGCMPHEDGLNPPPDAYSSRHSRPLSTIGWRSSERNARSRISHERLRSLSDGTNVHDGFAPEGPMIMDRSVMYRSRSLFDQHGDMRLDIDNLSYEELLALGERMGNVCTGLSEDSIPKCLQETTYCSKKMHEEGTCAICLEEYKNGEKVGMLMNCSHDYHVDCIKKWLLMKNVCPICKGPALDENLKK